MATTVPSPNKYHPIEWHSANNYNYKQSEKERSFSESLRTECERLCKDIEDTTLRTQRDVEHKFSQRINDIGFVKTELETKAKELADEIDALTESKSNLEQGLRNTNFPLKVAKDCLGFREKRQGIDFVHDEVEIQLMKEVEVIEGIQGLLGKSLDETIEQLRVLRSYKYKLEKDLKDKFGALAIDSDCYTLTTTSPVLTYAPGTVKVHPNSLTPEKWQYITNDNLSKAEQERIASTTLRGVIACLLDQTRQDMLKQRKTVNFTFNKRIQETGQAKYQLEGHLQEVNQEISAQENNLRVLKNAIESKAGPMQLAQTRLNYRSQRPHNELVKDPVQYRLIQEVDIIDQSIAKLQDFYLQAEASLKKLNRTQLTLEEDIAVKTNSLAIDEQQCMGTRSQMEE